MSRDEIILRAGFYSGFIYKWLNDASYIKRWRDQADTISDAEYLIAFAEIQNKLAAGVIGPDEDPFDKRFGV